MKRLLLALALAGLAVSCAKFSPGASDNPAEDVYQRKAGCIICHGKTGAGADGPSLLDRPLTRAVITDQILHGGNGMPAFEGRLTADEVKLATDWVVELRRRAGADTPDQ